jgi:hypothetical protein
MATLKNTRINDAGFLQLLKGTETQRTVTPQQGMIRFNTDLGEIEWYNPNFNEWQEIRKPARIIATGGTVTDITQDGKQYRVHTFTSDGTLEVTREGEVEYLTVDLDGRFLLQGAKAADADLLDGLDSTQFLRSDTSDTFTTLSGNSLDIGSTTYSSDTTSTTSTTQTQITLFSATAFSGAKLIVQMTDNSTNERHISELLVTHDGTTAFATEYGVVHTGTDLLASFDADISSGNVRLLATAASGNSTSYTVSETLMV